MANQTFGVATKAIIYKEGKYLLLFKSGQEEISPNSFDIPGGRLNFGEKPEEAVLINEFFGFFGVSFKQHILRENSILAVEYLESVYKEKY